MRRSLICCLVSLYLVALSLALPAPANPMLGEVSLFPNGVEVNSSVSAEPAGLAYAHYTNGRAINTLSTENIIIQVMTLLAQRDPTANVPQGIIALQNIPDVAMNMLPEPGQPFLPLYVMWSLASALGWLIDTHQDNFVVCFTRIELYGHTIGHVEILKAYPDGQTLDRTSAIAAPVANVTDPQAVSTGITTTTRRSSAISERGALSNSTTGIDDTSRSDVHELTVGDFSADVTYLRNTYNFGRDNMFQVLANAVVGLTEPGFDYRRNTFQIRNANFHARLTIVPHIQRGAPYNTKEYCLSSISIISEFLTQQRRYNPLEAQGKSNGQVVHVLRIVPYAT